MAVPDIDTGILNLTVEAGVKYSKRWNWGGTTTPPDFTGCLATGMVRETYPGTAVLITLGTAGSTAVTLGGTAGWFQIDIPAATTAALAATYLQDVQTWVWDFEVYEVSTPTNIIRPAKGTFTLNPEVTR